MIAPRPMAKLVISYSRADQAVVRDVVALLSGALNDIDDGVFWDADLVPGEDWFPQLAQHIDAAPQLFVFCCDHSAASAQVKREYEYALGAKKRVVPVLLDGTPLVPPLTTIQGIDARRAIRHRSYRALMRTSLVVAGMVASMFIVAAIVLTVARSWLSSTFGPNAIAPPSIPDVLFPGERLNVFNWLSPPLLFALVGLLIVWGVIEVRRDRRRKKAARDDMVNAFAENLRVQ